MKSTKDNECVSQEEYSKELARVEDIQLLIEEHGILTLIIMLHKEGSLHQGFGNYALDTWNDGLNRRVGTSSGLDYILQILNVFGVDKLEKIKGRMCYALYQPSNSLIKGIEALELDGGKRFTIKEWCKQWGISDE